MKRVETAIEQLLLASRWLLLVFYVGLAAGLVIYAAAFVVKVATLAATAFSASEEVLILAMLGLIDAALVASLVVMVIISSYENFISRFDDSVKSQLSWIGKLDSGSLKIKVASSIVAISSIHLLAVFLGIDDYPPATVMWSTIIHLTLVVSALLLAVLDRLINLPKA